MSTKRSREIREEQEAKVANSRIQPEREENAPKRYRETYRDTITVLVGEEEKPFTAHKSFLCKKSPFFEAACSKAWREGRQLVVRLRLVEPEVFAIYLHWAYSDEINTRMVVTEDECGKHTEPGHDTRKCEDMNTTELLVGLYVAADVLLDSALPNLVLDRLWDRQQTGLGAIRTETINFAWDNTDEQSLLRKFILNDIIINSRKTGLPKEYAGMLCNQFLLDLCNRQFEFWPSYVREVRASNQPKGVYFEKTHHGGRITNASGRSINQKCNQEPR